MGLIVTLIVGGVVGWIASIIMKTDKQMGILANVAVGIVGSVLGGWIFALLGFAAWGLIARLIVGVIGAVVLIAILKSFKILR
jgi:uncharacterized membrane protein YeaQ/YmgE (transglycosylase-associated protein family)